jgi:hypothetical protein
MAGTPPSRGLHDANEYHLRGNSQDHKATIPYGSRVYHPSSHRASSSSSYLQIISKSSPSPATWCIHDRGGIVNCVPVTIELGRSAHGDMTIKIFKGPLSPYICALFQVGHSHPSSNPDSSQELSSTVTCRLISIWRFVKRLSFSSSLSLRTLITSFNLTTCAYIS